MTLFIKFNLLFMLLFLYVRSHLNITFNKSLLEEIREEEINESHRTDSLSLLILVILIITTVLLTWMLKVRHIAILHETGFALLLGIMCGGILKLSLYYLEDEDLYNKIEYDNNSNPPLMINITNMTAFKPNENKILIPSSVQLDLNGSRFNYRLINEDIYNISINETMNIIQTIEYDKIKNQAPKTDDIETKSSFNAEIFFYVLLPPVVFYAGYELQRKLFLKNIGAICAFAFVGTIISCVLTGLGSWLFINYNDRYHHSNYGFGFSECLLLGSILSATDPITVLAIFNDLNVDPNLNALVFGESVLNDAVAIVLYRTISNLLITPKNDTLPKNFESYFVIEAIGSFLYIFVMSCLIGFLVGCLTARLTKTTKVHMLPLLETSIFVLMSYSSFLIAEVFNTSGIVSILVCGVIQKIYTHENLTIESQLLITQFFQLINYVIDNFIFAYIGLAVFLFSEHIWDYGFILWIILLLQISRAFNIYPISFFINISRSDKNKISYCNQHMMMWSGLRGAMAFALAIRNTVSTTRRMMLTATLSSVIFSVLFQGSLTLPLLKFFKLNVNIQQEQNVHKESSLNETSIKHNSYAVENDVNPDKIEMFRNYHSTPNIYSSNDENIASSIKSFSLQISNRKSNELPVNVDNSSNENCYLITVLEKFNKKYLKPWLTNSKNE